MHPRNIFKDVDFGELAEKCPFLKEFVLQSPKTSKCTLDFGNDDAVRALNRALLFEYFHLNIDIPKDCLIPRVPLRLNYILWIEDLLNHFKDVFPNTQNIIGLDIGTGPCAIYAILGAKKNGWCMHGTDINKDSIESATVNVERNHLQDRVKLHHVTPGSYCLGILNEGDSNNSFDFSMCNPPFFSDTKDDLVSENYPSIPWNSKSQIPQEIICQGGEVNFVGKMIQESYENPNLVKIYTTMIGVKKHLDPLTKQLQDYNCANFITCIFHQGKISRWGLAWSWNKSIDLKTATKTSDSSKTKKTSHKSNQVESIFPNIQSFPLFLQQMVNILKSLDMEVKQNPDNKSIMQIKAEKNTWSHSRRKRRMEKQILQKEQEPSKSDTFSSSSSSDDKPVSKFPRLEGEENVSIVTNTNEKEKNDEVKEEEGAAQTTIIVQNNHGTTYNGENTTGQSTGNVEKEIGLHFKLLALRQGVNVIVKLEYINGTFGKDGVNQVLQYLKNKFKNLDNL